MKRVHKMIILASIFAMSSNAAVYADTFYNLSDAENYIYQQFQNRDTKITFSYVGDKNEFKNNIANVIKAAYEKDDYIGRSWLKIDPKATVSGNEINTNIDVAYLTTKAQEDYVNIELKNIVSQLIKPNMSELQKVTAINNYIIARYDYDDTLKSNNAYSALTTSRTTCQGYAMTAYKILTMVGIKNRIIVGTLNGSSHAWNYVQVEGTWYHLDITSNDTTKDMYFLVPGEFMKANNYLWNESDYPQNLEK